MKLQILSDVHNEFVRGSAAGASLKWRGTIPLTDADVIVLAGDIDLGLEGIRWAMTEALRLGKPIIYVAGNHEYYGFEYLALTKDMRRISEGSLVHFLEQDEWLYQGVRFLGATLWTDYCIDPATPQRVAMMSCQHGINDHRLIRIEERGQEVGFTPSHALEIHRKSRKWLSAKLAERFDGETVVVTHHGPSPLCQHPKYSVSPVSAAFHSDLDDLMTDQVTLWVYGHTHSSLDARVRTTRLVSNQFGYAGREMDSRFASEFIVNLEG